MKNIKRKSVSIEHGGIDEYIADCPKQVRGRLADMRIAIRAVAPGAIETVSYFGMPGYSYEGYDYNGMFAWFSFKAPFVRLHVRPRALADCRMQLSRVLKNYDEPSLRTECVLRKAGWEGDAARQREDGEAKPSPHGRTRWAPCGRPSAQSSQRLSPPNPTPRERILAQPEGQQLFWSGAALWLPGKAR